MNIHKEYKKFVSEISDRLLKLDFELSNYVIDHACIRAESFDDYEKLMKELKSLSLKIVTNEHNDRLFHICILKDPLSIDGKYFTKLIEIAEPGGSSNYTTGFQHIECISLNDYSELMDTKNLLVTRSHGESYLNWESDNWSFKLTNVSVLVKIIREDSRFEKLF